MFTREDLVPPDLMPESPYPTASNINITTPGVLKMLQCLNVHKASGPDEICPRILKELASTIAPILTTIYRKSYDEGVLPAEWKSANVVPIYKKGKTTDASNYRPISLTCICCKMLEHMDTSHIMTHANDNDILYEYQHGFREKRSCETQLLEFQSDVLKNMQAGKQTDAVILDFSKVGLFDKVGHEHLTTKLKYYGIRGKTNEWIVIFLNHRTPAVVLDGERSHDAPLVSGVPQGSVAY